MKHWRLLALSCLALLAIPVARETEHRAEFPDHAERLAPASTSLMPFTALISEAQVEALASEAPPALREVGPAPAQAKVAAAKARKNRKERKERGRTAPENSHGIASEGEAVDGGETAYEAGARVRPSTDTEPPDGADRAPSEESIAEDDRSSQPEQDDTSGAGDPAASDDEEGADEGSWF